MSGLGRLFGKFRRASRPGTDAAAGRADTQYWIVAGLGNPGRGYARSRHNVGFRALDRLAKHAGAEFSRRKFNGLIAEATLGGERTLLVKPETYYNLSGECLAGVLGYFKLQPARLVVVHDDLDLEAGRLRLKQGGGDAGNRGVRSIAESLGRADFVRVRVGIGRPVGAVDSKDYVLEAVHSGEMRALERAAARAAEAVEAVIAEGLERAMSRFNQRA
jgi:peptidyl-tRNA hydrolase, PTH1 family